MRDRDRNLDRPLPPPQPLPLPLPLALPLPPCQVEDEAVIAHAATRVAGTHRLVSTREMIPQLRRRPGLLSWRVMHGGSWYDRYADLPAEARRCGLGLGCPSPHTVRP